MIKFYINLDSCPERKKYFDTTWKRFIATPRDKVDGLTDKKMISYHNVTRDYHLAKCGCWKSHTLLLRYICDNKLNNVIIVEDDAEQLIPIPDELYNETGFVYLGGFFINKKKTDGEFKGESNSSDGLNDLQHKDYDVCQTTSYYIGSYKVAEELLNEILSQSRYRAIDIMYINSKIPKKYYYPAIFRERPIESTIRKNKKKVSNEFYQLV